tara:strand:+ start:1454 stop:1891 length:438 start_codon:yes stop_codon:yes gene_type:complete
MHKLLTKILVQNMYIELGIVVPKTVKIGTRNFFNFDIKKELDKLSPRDARKARRKFRKLMRQINKRHMAELNKRKTRKGFKKYHPNSVCPQKILRDKIVETQINQYKRLYGYNSKVKNPRIIFNKKISVHNYIMAKIIKQMAQQK